MARTLRYRYSARGELLTYTGSGHTVPVVCLELCDKWYGVHIVNPDNTVETVRVDLIMGILDTTPAYWIDHRYHPQLLVEVARKIGGIVCPLTIELAIARWIIEDDRFWERQDLSDAFDQSVELLENKGDVRS